jgi:hypothetical protein
MEIGGVNKSEMHFYESNIQSFASFAVDLTVTVVSR